MSYLINTYKEVLRGRNLRPLNHFNIRVNPQLCSTPTTYKNIMSIINPKELQECCMYAYEELIEKARKNGDIYHFDGKVERGSARKTDKKNNKIKPLNVLNVYSEGAGVCIEQEMIEEKTNMDFTFKCDNNTTVDKKALYNLQILKKNALSVLNLVKEEYKKSMQKIRFIAGMDPEEELPKIFYIAKKNGWNFDKAKA